MCVLLPWYADKFLPDRTKNAMHLHGVFLLPAYVYPALKNLCLSVSGINASLL